LAQICAGKLTLQITILKQKLRMLNQNLLHFSLAVTVSRICYLLNGLSGNKATGIDKISCKIIKIAVPAISDSLTLIFNQAITLSSFPNEWKIARVIPSY
jgi:hypothetical protein